MLFARRASTLLTPPDSAGAPCSRRLPAAGAVFVLWSKYPKHLFVRIGTYQSASTSTSNTVDQQAGLCPCEIRSGGSNAGWRFFLLCIPFSRFFFYWHHVLCYQYKNMYDGDDFV